MIKRVLGLAVLMIPLCANAVPVRWTLDGILVGFFANPPPTLPYQPGTLTGNFVYDADTNVFSDINIYSSETNGFMCNPTRTDICLLTPASHPFAAQQYDTAITASPSTSSTGLVAVNGSRLNGILDGDTLLILSFAEQLTNAGGFVSLASGIEYYCFDLACLGATDDVFRSVIVPGSGSFQLEGYNPRFIGTPISISEPRTILLMVVGALLLVTLAPHRRRRKFMQRA